MNKNDTYFESFGEEHIRAEIKICIDISTIITNFFRIKAHYLVMCGYFCIRFDNCMLKGKSLIDFTNLFLQNNFRKKDDIILNYFITNV